jgi:hypothetical protein
MNQPTFASKADGIDFIKRIHSIGNLRKRAAKEGKKTSYVSSGSSVELVCSDPKCLAHVKLRRGRGKDTSDSWYIVETSSQTLHHCIDKQGQKIPCTGQKVKMQNSNVTDGIMNVALYNNAASNRKLGSNSQRGMTMSEFALLWLLSIHYIDHFAKVNYLIVQCTARYCPYVGEGCWRI